MFFGLFHLHRIWGLVDRNSYADFWIGVLESRGLKFWNKLLMWMFDVNSIYWNYVWLFFILLGNFAFCLGAKLLVQRNRTTASDREE